MAHHTHLDLKIIDAKPGSTQPVPAEDLGDGLFRVLHSPGFVEGIAAGDTIRLLDDGVGGFEVVGRGGNVCVKVFAEQSIGELRDRIERDLEPLGGFCDGCISQAAVFTIPVRGGFPAIQRVFKAATAERPGATWYFGNVLADDGKTLLGWWDEFLES